MAVYKVPQDVEAEDHILGPLSLKQLIFVFVFLMVGYGGFLAMKLQPFLIIPFLPFLFILGFLAAPISRQQPNEVWLAAMLHYYLKPKKRIWDQSGISELVKIIAPKKIEHTYTDGLMPDQVQSRLKILAGTLDSRGWAVKNVALNQYDAMVQSNSTAQTTDRLVTRQQLPQEVDNLGIREMDDVLNPGFSKISNKFDELLTAEQSKQRAHLEASMQQAASSSAPSTNVNDSTSLEPKVYSASEAVAEALKGRDVVNVALAASSRRRAGPTEMSDDSAFDTNPERQSSSNSSEAVAKRLDQSSSSMGPALRRDDAQAQDNANAQNIAKKEPDAGIINLARRSDLSVGTLAKIAGEQSSRELVDDQVIKLH
jgi:PrgI family protein